MNVHTSVADIRADELELSDVALGLSRLSRFHGLSSWSVARHSLLVAEALPLDLRAQGLMHDVAEVVFVGDCPTPVKSAAIRATEDRVMRLVAVRFGLPWPFHPAVKRADVRALRTEAEDEFGLYSARRIAPRIRRLDVELPTGSCRQAWLDAAKRAGLR